VLTLARGTRSHINGRGRVIDYRHVIDALKRKPQAFKGLVFRDALFPREANRRTWEHLELRLTQRQACQAIVALLEMATYDRLKGWCWPQRLDVLLVASELPDVKRLREEFSPRKTEVPLVTVHGLSGRSKSRQPINSQSSPILSTQDVALSKMHSTGQTGNW
jgi:hypothetical protein